MSNGDYISKSELIEELVKSENQPTRNRDDFIEGYCEGWNDVVDIMKKQPTVDEKEIIRKAFERVVERLKELKTNAFDDESVIISDAIEIVKEECGINE